MESDLNELCDECGGKIIPDPVKGNYLCTGCGLLLDVKFYDFRPVQSFGNQKRIHYEYFSPGTNKRMFTVFYGGGFKNKLLGMRLKNLQNKYSCGYNEIDNKSYHILKNMCRKLDLPETVLRQSIMFFSELSKFGFKGRNTEIYSVACVYLSARLAKIPLEINDFQYDRKEEKIIKRRIEEIKKSLKIYLPLMLTKDYVVYYFEIFKTDISVRKVALLLSEKIDRDFNVCGSPQITAMAVIVTSESFINGVNFRTEIKNHFGVIANLEKRIDVVESILKEVF